MDTKKIIKFIAFQVLGTVVFTLGVAGLVVAGLGSGSIDAAAYFSSLLFGLTQGTWTFILNFSLAAVLLIFTRKPKVLLNVAMLFVASFFIDIWIKVFENIFKFEIKLTTININNGFVEALLVAIFSFIVLAVGVSILIHNKSILSPLDEFTVFLAGFTKKYFIAKIIVDGSFLVMAIILGLFIGPKEISKQINFFSFIIVFLLGPVINLLLHLFKKGDESLATQQVY